MFEQANGAVEFLEFSIDNFVGNVLRFAFDLSFINFALSFDEIAWHIGTADVKRVRRCNMQSDVLHKLAEVFVPSHEVSLAIHFHEHSNLPLQVNIGSYDAFFRYTQSFLSSAGNSFGPQNRLRFSQIAAALNKSPFAIHEACVGLFPELLNQLGIDLSCCFH